VHFEDNWVHERVPSMNANHDKTQSAGLRYAPASYE
jgi:hypothetical protein